MHPPHNNHFAWMVPTFVVINIGLFALALYINDCPSHSTDCVAQDLLGRFAFQSLRENPLLGPSASTLQLMGALEVKKVVEEHEVWRLLSCSWLHAGVLHVLANMVSLLFVGIRLEEEFGFVRIGLLYIISGLGGSLLSALFIRTTISVGASGALFGLLGGMLSELLTNWTIYTNKFAALLTLILIIAINLAVGILPHVDNFAHVGGFVTGFFLGFVFLIRPQYAWVRQRYSPPGYIGIKSKPKYKPRPSAVCKRPLTINLSVQVVLDRQKVAMEKAPELVGGCRLFMLIALHAWGRALFIRRSNCRGQLCIDKWFNPLFQQYRGSNYLLCLCLDLEDVVGRHSLAVSLLVRAILSITRDQVGQLNSHLSDNHSGRNPQVSQGVFQAIADIAWWWRCVNYIEIIKRDDCLSGNTLTEPALVFLGRWRLTAGLVLLLSGVDGNNYCSWCHHLRCVPTPFWKCNSEQVYCESNISGNQLNLKCLSNRKSKLYTLEGTYDTTYLEHLCSELCS
ncbi:hypothetical protein CsSME_00040990 [Camellia sinensis var. sinensis]